MKTKTQKKSVTAEACVYIWLTLNSLMHRTFGLWD